MHDLGDSLFDLSALGNYRIDGDDLHAVGLISLSNRLATHELTWGESGSYRPRNGPPPLSTTPELSEDLGTGQSKDASLNRWFYPSPGGHSSRSGSLLGRWPVFPSQMHP